MQPYEHCGFRCKLVPGKTGTLSHMHVAIPLRVKGCNRLSKARTQDLSNSVRSWSEGQRVWERWARSSYAATVRLASRLSPGMTFSRVPWNARKPAEKAAVGLALGLYAGLLAYMIPRHEPWADEAQAWELAQSLSLKSLFGTYIHYEGSPGLWHALLWMLSRLHVTYSGMHWVAGAIALAGVVLLTVAAPFPLVLRLLLPFTYFFAFQYSVVARSYVLFPTILFALACFWPRRRSHPLPAVLLMGLLGNVSAHGFVVALGLTMVLAIEWYCTPKEERAHWRAWLGPAVLLTAMLGFAAWCIMPAPDAGWLVVAKRVGTHDQSAALADQLSELHPRARFLSSQLRVASAILYQFAHELGHGLADKFHLGIIVWVLLVWGWVREGLLRYSLPAVFLLGICAPFQHQFYHAGLLWVLFLFLWWVTWQERMRASPERKLREAGLSQKALLIAVMLCVAFHLVWAMTVIRYDASNAYSPNLDGVAVLKEYLNRGDKIDVAIPPNEASKKLGEFFITGVEPYFTTEPINNMPFRFWFWGWDGEMRARYLLDTENRSAVVVVEETDEDLRYKIEERRLGSKGYRRGRVVCGQIFYPDMKSSPYTNSSPLCHAFYEPQNR
jgi:hypothetical protein